MQKYIGLSREEQFDTSEKHSAHAYGNIGVHVVATVSLIAFVEECSGRLLQSLIDKDERSVGSIVNIKHRSVAHLGVPVHVQCTISAYQERKVLFSCHVYQNNRLILEGSHGRVVLSQQTFSSLQQ